MKKSYLILAAIASVALVSCSNEEYLGEGPNTTSNGIPNAINFSTGTKKITRADFTGADAAEKLNNNFVFMGTKTVSGTSSNVFDHYKANWVENTANTTESNSNDWEYVGNTPATGTTLPTGATQSIKYWDYAASQYDFAAYSLGKGFDEDDDASTENTFATASAFDFDELGSGDPVYTLSGTLDQLKECYISDLVTHYNNTTIDEDAATTFGKVVNFSFRSLATKIRLAFYETIPGYSVKNVLFYADNNNTTTTSSSTPTLFTAAGGSTLPAQAGDGTGTIAVSFPTVGWDASPEKNGTSANTDYNKAHVTFTPTGSTSGSATMTFDALDDFASLEKMETVDEVALVSTLMSCLMRNWITMSMI